MGNLIKDTLGEIESACIGETLTRGKNTLESFGYKIVTLEDMAGLMLQEQNTPGFFHKSNWVQEDFIYVSEKGVYLSKNSPILNQVYNAKSCQEKNGEFYLTEEQVEESLENSVFLSKTKNKIIIPTNDFKNNKITNYAFGKFAENYGNYLRNFGWEEYSFEFKNLKEKPFARKAWFTGSRAGIIDLDRNISNVCKVRGTKKHF
jgi:nuclear transport factor 2 (NTF2) superfamily protein